MSEVIKMSETFLVEVQAQERVKIPRSVIRALALKKGDLVRVTVEKVS